jgi:hypothetical protein
VLTTTVVGKKNSTIDDACRQTKSRTFFDRFDKTEKADHISQHRNWEDMFMSTVSIPQFACPSCDRKNVWKPAIAGKRAKCACGNVISVPSFAPTTVASAAPATPVAAGAVTRKPAAAKPAVGMPARKSVMADIPYRKGLQPEAPVAAAVTIPPIVRDVVLPVILIVAGVYATTADAMQASGARDSVSVAAVIGPVIVTIIVGLGLAVAAVLGGAIVAGIAFDGPLWQNIVKLCAIALLPLPVGSMVGRSIGGINGDIASSFVSIALYFALFWAVFKMAWSDRTVCVMTIWIVRSLVAYAMFKFSGMMHGNSI